MYASGRAIQRDLTNSVKELTYTNAFNTDIQFLLARKRREMELAVSKPIVWSYSAPAG
jgi:hypothetical protein